MLRGLYTSSQATARQPLDNSHSAAAEGMELFVGRLGSGSSAHLNLSSRPISIFEAMVKMTEIARMIDLSCSGTPRCIEASRRGKEKKCQSRDEHGGMEERRRRG